MSETAQEMTAVTATLVEHEPEVLPALTDEKAECIVIFIDSTSVHAYVLVGQNAYEC